MQSLPPLLIVDDNDDDIFLLRSALQKVGLRFFIHEARNGIEAREYLSGAGQFSDRESFPFPTLVILDLQMPIFDGFMLLDWMGDQAGARHPTVVVLSASARTADIERVAASGIALAYFVKSLLVETMLAVARCLRDAGQYNRLLDLRQARA